jgi:hypothetical protein
VFAVLRRLREDLIPAAGHERRYALAIFLDSIGDGLFLTGTTVFALRAVGLSAQEVGIALSIAGVAGFLGASTLGTVADRLGARRTMTVLCLLEAFGYLLFVMVGSFATFTAVSCFVAAAAFGKGPATSALVSVITAGERRVRLRAQVRSLHNLSFALGAALAGLCLGIGTLPAYYALPLGDALMVLAEVVVIRGLPETRAEVSSKRRSFTALRNVPFLFTTALNGVLALYGTLIMVVVPLWIVGPMGAPAPLISALLLLNTVLVVLFQVRLSAGAETLDGSIRKGRLAAVVLAIGCVFVGLSSGTPLVVGISVVCVGAVLLTVGEMVHSGSMWGMAYELAPRQAQAEYLAGLEMSNAGQSIVGPAFGTWLVLTFGLTGWTILGALFIVAAVLIGPAAHWTAARLAVLYPESEAPEEPEELPRAA